MRHDFNDNRTRSLLIAALSCEIVSVLCTIVTAVLLVSWLNTVDNPKNVGSDLSDSISKSSKIEVESFIMSDSTSKTSEIEAESFIMSDSTSKTGEIEIENSGDNTPNLISLGEFTLTAYCPCVECCGEWSESHPSRIGTGYIQRTASGTIPKEGRTIGVDPDVIPFGSTIVINGHEYVAEDTSGGISETSIDVFFDTHDAALNFGVQKAEVFLKKDATADSKGN